MKAAFINQHGGLENIQIGELDVPKIGPTDVLIKTKFGGLNHIDIFIAKGWPGLKISMPHVLGADGSGIIEDIGSEVDTIQKGDKVTINPGLSCGKCDTCLSGRQNLCKKFSIMGEHQWGTYSEYFKVPEINVIKVPDKYPLDKAAAAPLTFLTAWRMLITQAQLKSGDIVFIHGAGGGVSTAAIQIAKHFQAKVITSTSSSEKVQKAKELGADHVINYKEMPDYGSYVYKELTNRHGIDVVVDSVGTATFSNSIRLLAPAGRIVICGATTGPMSEIDIRHIFWKQLEIKGSTMSNQGEFRAVMKLVLKNHLNPIVDKIFSLSEVRKAEEYLSAANQFGKVLVEIS